MKLELPDVVEKPVEEVITPVATSIGKTLSDLWFLAMGGISHKAEKKKIKYAFDIEKLKKSLEEKTEAIPLKNRVEPNTQIICQALDDSKYCVEDEDIREMFANLITSTMDSRFSKTVHPSFSLILKQMSSTDAKFLLKFRTSNQLPICNIKEDYLESDAQLTLFSDYYVEQIDHSEQTIYDNAFTISTLRRLGLINVTYSRYLAANNIYDVFNESLFFRGYSDAKNGDPDISITLVKGIMELTHLGKNFLKTCCPHENIEGDINTSAQNNVL